MLSADDPGKFLLSAVWGVIVGGGIFYVLFQVSRGRWIGGGDVKLGALLGLIVAGPARAMLVIFLGSLLGTLVSAPRPYETHQRHTVRSFPDSGRRHHGAFRRRFPGLVPPGFPGTLNAYAIYLEVI